jgi:hypothetical protein
MGLEKRTTIAQWEGEREGHVPPLPPWRRAGLTQPRESRTRPPPVPLARVAASRRGGPIGTTRAPHSGDGEKEKRRTRPDPTGPTAERRGAARAPG